MEKTSATLMFKWFEEVWTQSEEEADVLQHWASCAIAEGGASVPVSWEEFKGAHHNLKEDLADICLGFESFCSDGDRVTCAMVVKARNKVSGAPIAFRSTLDGHLRDGRLVSASNAIDYLPAE